MDSVGLASHGEHFRHSESKHAVRGHLGISEEYLQRVLQEYEVTSPN